MPQKISEHCHREGTKYQLAYWHRSLLRRRHNFMKDKCASVPDLSNLRNHWWRQVPVVGSSDLSMVDCRACAAGQKNPSVECCTTASARALFVRRRNLQAPLSRTVDRGKSFGEQASYTSTATLLCRFYLRKGQV